MLKNSIFTRLFHKLMGDKQIFDLQQIEYLKNDNCIIVDKADKVLRSSSKYECHLKRNIDAGLLHRAFSLFIFDSNNKLLLQQRSDKKITFPLHFTNTCCSHPLFVKDELDMINNMGIKRAAVRKADHELGMEITVKQIDYITRIFYKADNFVPNSIKTCQNEQYQDFAENELDYILVTKLDVDMSNAIVKLNPNEVADIKWIGQLEMEQFIEECKINSIPISPWFSLIYFNGFLNRIWDNLDQLDTIVNHEEIIDFTK